MRRATLPLLFLFVFLLSSVEGPSVETTFVYSGSETLICPPSGYKPKPAKTSCPLNYKKVHDWIDGGQLTERLGGSKVASTSAEDNQQIQLPPTTVGYLRRYTE